MKIDHFFSLVIIGALVYIPVGYGAQQKENSRRDEHVESLAVSSVLLGEPYREVKSGVGSQADLFVSPAALSLLMLNAVKDNKPRAVAAGLEALVKNNRDVPAFLNGMCDKKTGMTALMIAARQGDEQIVAQLLTSGATTGNKDLQGRDVFDYVVRVEDSIKRVAVFKQLLSAKDIINRADKKASLMERSMQNSDETLLSLLVEDGMSPGLMNRISVQYVPALSAAPIAGARSFTIEQVNKKLGATTTGRRKKKENRNGNLFLEQEAVAGDSEHDQRIRDLEREQQLADESFRALMRAEEKKRGGGTGSRPNSSKMKKNRNKSAYKGKTSDKRCGNRQRDIQELECVREQSSVCADLERLSISEVKDYEVENEEKKASECIGSVEPRKEAQVFNAGGNEKKNGGREDEDRKKGQDGEACDVASNELPVGGLLTESEIDSLSIEDARGVYDWLKNLRASLVESYGILKTEFMRLQNYSEEKDQQEYDELMMEKAKEFEMRYQASMKIKEEEALRADYFKLADYDASDSDAVCRWKRLKAEDPEDRPSYIRQKLLPTVNDFIASRTKAKFKALRSKPIFRHLDLARTVISPEQQKVYDLEHCRIAVDATDIEALTHFMRKAGLGVEDQKPFLNDMLLLVIEKEDYAKTSTLLEMGADIALVADNIRVTCHIFNQAIANNSKEWMSKKHLDSFCYCMMRAQLSLEERQPILNALLEQLFNQEHVNKRTLNKALGFIDSGANPACVEDKIRRLPLPKYEVDKIIGQMKKQCGQFKLEQFCTHFDNNKYKNFNVKEACALLEEAQLSSEDKQKKLNFFLLKMVETSQYKNAFKCVAYGATPSVVEEVIRATCTDFVAKAHIKAMQNAHALCRSKKALAAGDIDQALLLLPEMEAQDRKKKLFDYLTYVIEHSEGQAFGNVMPLIAAGAQVDEKVRDLVYKKYNHGVARELVASMKREQRLFLSRAYIANGDIDKACDELMKVRLPLDVYQRELDSFFLQMVSSEKYQEATRLVDYGAKPFLGYKAIRAQLTEDKSKMYIKEMDTRRIFFLSNQAMYQGDIEEASKLLLALSEEMRFARLKHYLVMVIQQGKAGCFDNALRLIKAGAPVDSDVFNLVYSKYSDRRAQELIALMNKSAMMYSSYYALEKRDIKMAVKHLKQASLSLDEYQKILDGFLIKMIQWQEYEKALELIKYGANHQVLTDEDLVGLNIEDIPGFIAKMGYMATLFSSKEAIEQGATVDACILLQSLPVDMRQAVLDSFLNHAIRKYKDTQTVVCEQALYRLVEFGAHYDQDTINMIRKSRGEHKKKQAIIQRMFDIYNKRMALQR